MTLRVEFKIEIKFAFRIGWVGAQGVGWGPWLNPIFVWPKYA